MSITANKLISDIRNIATSGKPTDDFRISDRQILYWINQTRSQLIAAEIQKRRDYSDVWIQSINCLELEYKDISDCCNVSSGCYGLVSKFEIPSTIETDKINEIVSVTTLDGSNISKINQFSNKFKKYNKYTKEDKGWFIKNKRLYVVNDELLNKVIVKGIFEDPSDLEKFYNCDSTPCWSVDSEYPVSYKMAGIITDMIIRNKVYTLMTFPQDVKGDSSNEQPSPGKLR